MCCGECPGEGRCGGGGLRLGDSGGVLDPIQNVNTYRPDYENTAVFFIHYSTRYVKINFVFHVSYMSISSII